MKINTKFEIILKNKKLAKLQKSYEIAVRENEWYSFYRINFHPMGEPEASICSIINAEA